VEAAFFDLDTAVCDPSIYLEALDLIALHRARGRTVYVVSASPAPVVRPLARRIGVIGVSATRVVASRGGASAVRGRPDAAQDKAAAIRGLAAREGVDLAGSYAYADSIVDLPMLETVGRPVAVNPDRALRRVADERAWPIRDFRRRVRLPDRPASESPTATALRTALGAAALGLAAWVVARTRATKPSRA